MVLTENNGFLFNCKSATHKPGEIISSHQLTLASMDGKNCNTLLPTGYTLVGQRTAVFFCDKTSVPLPSRFQDGLSGSKYAQQQKLARTAA